MLRPVKVVITNYPEGQTEEFDAVNNPEDRIGRNAEGAVLAELYIDQDDFRETPPPKYFRLYAGAGSAAAVARIS